MDPSLTIENSGRKFDGCYVGVVVGFWFLWTPVTLWATAAAIDDFSWFWVVWLAFGFLGVLVIPYLLIQSQKPHLLTSTEEFLLVRGTHLPFTKEVRIPREKPITLHLGRLEESGERESVVTLNLMWNGPSWTRRIMLSNFSHPSEKREIFRNVRAFLEDQGFSLEVVDDHPESRAEED